MELKNKGFIKDILRLNKTVFTFKELAMLWKKEDKTIKSRITYYLKQGDLYHIRRGFYAKDKNYNRLEMANKLFTPAYISFETVLLQAGIIFQYYSQIFVACPISRTLEIDGQKYVFKKIKSSILINVKGIERKNNCYIASPERAFLDILYLNRNYYFDNLGSLDWNKIYEILPVYGGNKRMAKVVAEQHAFFLEEYKQ